MTDKYGREIVVTHIGDSRVKYQIPGVEIVLPVGRDPIEVFNGMAPEGEPDAG